MLHFFLRRATVREDLIKYGPHIPYFTFRRHADSKIAIRWDVFGERRPEPGSGYERRGQDYEIYCLARRSEGI